MLSTLRSLVRLITWVAGFALLVATILWFKARNGGDPISSRLEFTWILSATVLAASALVGIAIAGLIRDRNRQEQDALDRTGVFEASASARHMILLAGLCLLFGVGAWAALMSKRVGLALLALGLLVVMLAVSWSLLRQVWRQGPMLRIDRQGIDHALYGPIPWEDVIGLTLQTIRVKHNTVHTLWLGVRTPYRYLRHASGPVRWINEQRSHRHASFGPLPIPLNTLGKDAKHIHHCARVLRETHAAPLLPHWSTGMRDAEIATWLESHALQDELRDIADELEASDPDEQPAAMARFDARIKAYAARREALRPHVRNALDASAQRMARMKKTLWILSAIAAFLVLLRILT